MEEKQIQPTAEVLEIAAEAGHIMLENGAEIARVEETMDRISAHYGVTSRNFYVLSNGIFTTGASSDGSDVKHNISYANVEYIPIKGTQMDKIVETNRLSREIEDGKYTIPEARAELKRIRAMKPKPAWEQIVGSAVGSSAFCAVFGGGFLDCAACFVVGSLVWMFVMWVTAPRFSKLLANILDGALVAALCLLFWNIGFGKSLGNMIVGGLISLIPGVAFLNGIRDMAHEDYLAGTTRLLDALVVFFGITIGACLVLIIHGYFTGGVIMLGGALTSPETARLLVQTMAGFFGTVAFAVLFGAPRNQYLATGIVGAIGWAVYFILVKYTVLTAIGATFFTSILVSLMAYETAVLRKCPVTVFLICGLFPLIPGGGVFWTTYFLVSKQYHLAMQSGVLALSITVAIVIGVVIVSGLPRKVFSRKDRSRKAA